MNFEQYFFCEDPDEVEFNVGGEKYTDSCWSNHAFPFGTIDLNFKTFSHKGDIQVFQGESFDELRDKLFIGQAGETHADMIGDIIAQLHNGVIHCANHFNGMEIACDLSNPTEKQQFIKNEYWNFDRNVFAIKGRVWNTPDKVCVVSFWQENRHTPHEVDVNFLTKLFGKLNVPHDKWNDARIEFLEDAYDNNSEDKDRTTFAEFSSGKDVVKYTDDMKQKMQDALAKKHLVGGMFSGDFGSKKRAKLAQSLKYPTIAQMSHERHPLSEHKH